MPDGPQSRFGRAWNPANAMIPAVRSRPEATLAVRLSKTRYYLVDNIYVSYIIVVDRLGSRTKVAGLRIRFQIGNLLGNKMNAIAWAVRRQLTWAGT
jgi:hypothetical protein